MKRIKSFFIINLLAVLAVGCGGSSTGTDSTGGTGSSGGSTTTVTLSGQALVTASDAAASLSPNLLSLALATKPKFESVGDTPLPSTEGSVIKREADGDTSTVATFTTDATGNYTVDVPAVTSGTGATTDFYYEVRVGSLGVRAAVAPEANTTVNVTPESHLAAVMITDADNVEANALPRPAAIEKVRTLATDEIVDLKDEVEIPSLSNTSNVSSAAIAFASDGRNAERVVRAYEAEKEQVALESSTDIDAVGSYLERVARQGCNFNGNFNLPQTAREAIAQSFIDDTTLTSAEIVTAFNDNNGNDTDASATSAVNEMDEMLTDLDEAFEDKTAIDSSDDVTLYVKRNLTAATFDQSTELKVDQAIAFTQTLFPTHCTPGSFDFIGFLSDLSGSDILSAPAIVDRQVFHDMGFGCSETGHLRAEVQVYAAGGATVNGVTLTKGSTTKSLNSNGQNGPFSRWTLSRTQADAESDTPFYCMTLPSNQTYTITVDLNGASDLTEQVTVQHRQVPEASLSMIEDGDEIPMTSDSSVTPSSKKRPIFKWSPEPGTPDSSVIADAPSGSKIKFTFVNYYRDTTGQNRSFDATACPRGGSDVRLLDRNYFIPETDCDIPTCAAASGVSESEMDCRTNIQTFLVDENDRFLGQAAGNFRSYCYDSNDDGDCGN